MRLLHVLIVALCSINSCTGFVSRFQTRDALVRPTLSSSKNDAVLVSNSTEQQQQQQQMANDGIIQMDSITYSGYSLNGYSSSSGYHNDLPSGREDPENEDGYKDMFGEQKQSVLKRVAKFPVDMFRRAYHGGPKKVEPGKLILVRHGESEWNANKTFTGWSDPDLSADGVREVEHAARLLLEGGWEIDMVFTSRLKRAIRSAWIILQEMNQMYLPVFKSWRLNERYVTLRYVNQQNHRMWKNETRIGVNVCCIHLIF